MVLLAAKRRKASQRCFGVNPGRRFLCLSHTLISISEGAQQKPGRDAGRREEVPSIPRVQGDAVSSIQTQTNRSTVLRRLRSPLRPRKTTGRYTPQSLAIGKMPFRDLRIAPETEQADSLTQCLLGNTAASFDSTKFEIWFFRSSRACLYLRHVIGLCTKWSSVRGTG
jgi:hypothetical protein